MVTRHLVRQSGNYYLWHYPELEGKLGSYPYKLEFYNGKDTPSTVGSYLDYNSAIKHMKFFTN